MSSKPAMGAALAKVKAPEKPKREKVFNAKATPGRQGKRGITYYVTNETLEELRAIAEEIAADEDRDVLLKDVVQEALNMMLVKHNRKPTA